MRRGRGARRGTTPVRDGGRRPGVGRDGGGPCCARHLLDHGAEVRVALDRDLDDPDGAAAAQWNLLDGMGVTPADDAGTAAAADLAVDALVGYSPRGTPRGRAADLIEACNEGADHVLVLDVPSGVDATTGERRAWRSNRTGR